MISNEIQSAILKQTGRGWRLSHGRYETFVTQNGKSINLGTYDTESEAANAVQRFRLSALRSCFQEAGLNEDDAKLVHLRYIAFPDGELFNLYGKPMVGHTDRCGYSEIILNGKQHRRHRVIAEAFVPNPTGKPFINHKNGVKTDNRADNLEWVTRSENARHSFANGLQRIVGGGGKGHAVMTKEEKEIVASLHAAGYTDLHIAEKLGKSRSCVSKHIRRLGLR